MTQKPENNWLDRDDWYSLLGNQANKKEFLGLVNEFHFSQELRVRRTLQENSYQGVGAYEYLNQEGVSTSIDATGFKQIPFDFGEIKLNITIRPLIECKTVSDKHKLIFALPMTRQLENDFVTFPLMSGLQNLFTNFSTSVARSFINQFGAIHLSSDTKNANSKQLKNGNLLDEKRDKDVEIYKVIQRQLAHAINYSLQVTRKQYLSDLKNSFRVQPDKLTEPKVKELIKGTHLRIQIPVPIIITNKPIIGFITQDNSITDLIKLNYTLLNQQLQNPDDYRLVTKTGHQISIFLCNEEGLGAVLTYVENLVKKILENSLIQKDNLPSIILHDYSKAVEDENQNLLI